MSQWNSISGAAYLHLDRPDLVDRLGCQDLVRHSRAQASEDFSQARRLAWGRRGRNAAVNDHAWRQLRDPKLAIPNREALNFTQPFVASLLLPAGPFEPFSMFAYGLRIDSHHVHEIRTVIGGVEWKVA